jgi:hypothetical protein
MSGWRVLAKCCVHAKTRPGSLWKEFAEKEMFMLYTIAIVLIILWLLGLVSGYTIGSFIHVLLIIAIVMVLVNFISGRKRA